MCKLKTLPEVRFLCLARDALAKEEQPPHSIKTQQSKLAEAVASQGDAGCLEPGQQSGEQAGCSSVTERSQTLERKLGVRLQYPGTEGESQEGLSQATGYAAAKVAKSLAETEGQGPAVPAQEGQHRHELGDRKAAVPLSRRHGC